MDESSEDNASGFQKKVTNLELLILLIQRAPEAVRIKFDEEFSPELLQKELYKKKLNKLEPLLQRNIITKPQWSLLFPPQGKH